MGSIPMPGKLFAYPHPCSTSELCFGFCSPTPPLRIQAPPPIAPLRLYHSNPSQGVSAVQVERCKNKTRGIDFQLVVSREPSRLTHTAPLTEALLLGFGSTAPPHPAEPLRAPNFGPSLRVSSLSGGSPNLLSSEPPHTPSHPHGLPLLCPRPPQLLRDGLLLLGGRLAESPGAQPGGRRVQRADAAAARHVGSDDGHHPALDAALPGRVGDAGLCHSVQQAADGEPAAGGGTADGDRRQRQQVPGLRLRRRARPPACPPSPLPPACPPSPLPPAGTPALCRQPALQSAAPGRPPNPRRPPASRRQPACSTLAASLTQPTPLLACPQKPHNLGLCRPASRRLPTPPPAPLPNPQPAF
eukprot:scaffold7917_cov113-Isochrysis_galbana.AAC.1